MTSEELAEILAKAFKADGGAAGETPLDRLVRRAVFDPGIRPQIEAALGNLVQLLSSLTQWRGLDILIGQLKLHNPISGEIIEQRLSEGQLLDPESRIWAARCSFELGATLSENSYKILDEVSVIETNPREWVALMFDAANIHLAEQQFYNLPDKIKLNDTQAAEIVRLVKRLSPKLGLKPNGAITKFLDALPRAQAAKIAAKLEPVIGPSFKAQMKLKNPDRHMGHKRIPQADEGQLQGLFKGMQRVAEKTTWSYGKARRQMDAAA